MGNVLILARSFNPWPRLRTVRHDRAQESPRPNRPRERNSRPLPIEAAMTLIRRLKLVAEERLEPILYCRANVSNADKAFVGRMSAIKNYAALTVEWSGTASLRSNR